MAGLVPAIHVFVAPTQKDVDARHKAHKAGHDESGFMKLGIMSRKSGKLNATWGDKPGHDAER
jgi:hypothetical protein